MKFTKISAITYILLLYCSSIMCISEKASLTKRHKLEKKIKVHSNTKNTNKGTTSVKAYLKSFLSNCSKQEEEKLNDKSPRECLGDFDYLEFTQELIFSELSSLQGDSNIQLKSKFCYNELNNLCFVALGKAIEEEINQKTNIGNNMVAQDLTNHIEKIKNKLHLMTEEAEILDCKKDNPKELCEISNNLHKLSELRIIQKIDNKNKRIKSLVNILSLEYNLQDINENLNSEYDYIVRLYKTETYLKKIHTDENNKELKFENKGKMKDYFKNSKDENLWKSVRTHHEIKYIIFERMLKLKEKIKYWKKKLVDNKSMKKPICKDLPEKSDNCLDIGITTLLFGFFRALEKHPSLLTNCRLATGIDEDGMTDLKSKISEFMIDGISGTLGAGLLSGFAISNHAIKFWKSYREAESYSQFAFPNETEKHTFINQSRDKILNDEKSELFKTKKSAAWGKTIGNFIKVAKLIIGIDNFKKTNN